MRPTIGVVVPTRDRPELLRLALDAIRAQTYDGPVRIVVVHDGTPLDTTLGDDVEVIANDRTPGLAGARNTGILALDTDLVAFCDDDDAWEPTKLARQVERWLATGRPVLVTTAISVAFDGRRTDRLAGTDLVTHADLTRSIMAMLHSSTMLFDRTGLVGMGLVDEQIPGSMNEDWDLKLRAAALGPIAHVDEPLVVVRWGASSHFARVWSTRNASLEWMLAQHPAIGRDRRGVGRVYGQLAFGEAATGHRRPALRWAGRALRRDPLQWRAVAALPVAAGIVGPDRVMNTLHRFGRGV